MTEQGYDRRDSILSSDKKNSGANSERRGSLFGLFKKNTGFLTPKQKVKEEVSNPFLLLPPAIREQLIKARENVLNDSSLNSSRRIEVYYLPMFLMK